MTAGHPSNRDLKVKCGACSHRFRVEITEGQPPPGVACDRCHRPISDRAVRALVAIAAGTLNAPRVDGSGQSMDDRHDSKMTSLLAAVASSPHAKDPGGACFAGCIRCRFERGEL